MPKFITNSKKMLKINQLIDKASGTDTTVLIAGEKGAGKSFCARCIHDSGLRRGLPFVRFAANKEDTGFPDCINEAAGGTLFIDEVAYLRPRHQKELAKALAPETSTGGFRLIASTSRPLEPLVKNGSFLEDLYFRLCVMQIRLPSLRERKEDIPALVDFLAEKVSGESGRIYRFDTESKKALSSRPWKGNIGELENYIRFAADNTPAGSVTTKDLDRLDMAAGQTQDGESLNDELYNIACEFLGAAKQSSTYTAFEQYRKLVIPPALRAALHVTDGNKSMAAQLLGINRNTLKKMMRDYNIED